MALQTLALVFDIDTGRVTQSGLTSNALPALVRKTLAMLGIDFGMGQDGRILDVSTFTTLKRGHIISEFNRRFNNPRNPTFSKVDAATDVNEDPFAAADTTLTVDDGTKFAAGDYIQIDQEIMLVTNVATHNLTVTRGMFGTADVAHANNADIYIIATYALTITAA